MTLPLVPQDVLDDAFLYIMEDCDNSGNMEKFNDYYVNTWMEGGRFPPSLWNVSGQRHRARLDSVEKTSRKPENFLKFLNILKSDAQYQIVRYRQFCQGPSTSRRSDVKEKDERIRSILNDLATRKISVGHCVKKLSTFVS